MNFGHTTTAANGRLQSAVTVKDICDAAERLEKLGVAPPPAKVYSSIHALERVPAKELKHKAWMQYRCYHRRVQKKWIKRYGYESRPTAYQTPFGIVAHPAIIQQMRQQFSANIRNDVESMLMNGYM